MKKSKENYSLVLCNTYEKSVDCIIVLYPVLYTVVLLMDTFELCSVFCEDLSEYAVFILINGIVIKNVSNYYVFFTVNVWTR